MFTKKKNNKKTLNLVNNTKKIKLKMIHTFIAIKVEINIAGEFLLLINLFSIYQKNVLQF